MFEEGSTMRVREDAETVGGGHGNHSLVGKTVTIAKPGRHQEPGETTVIYEGAEWYVRTDDLEAVQWPEVDITPRDATGIAALISACEDAFSVGDADEDEDVAAPPIGITFGMIMRARVGLADLETYVKQLESRIAEQRIQIRAHMALQSKLGNKSVRKRAEHLEAALGRMTLKYDRQKMATEALVQKLRAKTEECGVLTARHLYGRGGEILPGDRVEIANPESRFFGRTGCVVPKDHLSTQVVDAWDYAVSLAGVGVNGFQRTELRKVSA